MKYIFTFSIDLFEVDIVFYLGSYEKMKKIMATRLSKTDYNKLIDYCDGDYQGILYSNKNNFLIHILEFDYGILAHEITHAVFGITDYVGIEYVGKSDNSRLYKVGSEEVYAYLHAYITKQILQHLKK